MMNRKACYEIERGQPKEEEDCGRDNDSLQLVLNLAVVFKEVEGEHSRKVERQANLHQKEAQVQPAEAADGLVTYNGGRV